MANMCLSGGAEGADLQFGMTAGSAGHEVIHSKTCSKCCLEKPLSAFSADRTKRNGYRANCKACVMLRRDTIRLNRTLVILTEKTCSICQCQKAVSEFYKSEDSSDGFMKRCKECTGHRDRARWRMANRKRGTELRMIANAKRRAKRSGVPCTLTIGDIFIPTHCPILGLELVPCLKVVSDNSPSIDRIIPKKGYVKDNVVIISARANRIKNDATLEELERITKWLKTIVA